MVNTKVFANGNVDVWVGPVSAIANLASPTAGEINAMLNISNAIAWDGTTIPAPTESNDTDDRSIKDRGNATSRGFAQYEGTLNLFRPKVLGDTSDDYGKTFEFFRKPRFTFIAVVRTLQGVENELTPAVAGEYVSVFVFHADTFINDLDGETSYKYTVELLSQGAVYSNTLVKLASPPTVVNASLSGSLAVGDTAVLRATLGTHRATQLVEWVSSDPEIANVSANGVVTARAIGTASITANHPSASAASTPVVITVA